MATSFEEVATVLRIKRFNPKQKRLSKSMNAISITVDIEDWYPWVFG